MREYQRAHHAHAKLSPEERRLHQVPPCLRFVVSDVTIEALAKRLAENPRGLLLERDELSGWVGSFNAYKKNASMDVAQYLELWRAGSIVVDRKNPDAPMLYVPRAALCITGGVQPEVLKRAIGLEHFDSGLVARFLLAFPPRGVKRWSETEIDELRESELATFFDRLLGIPLPVGSDGDPQPEPVVFDADAKSRLVRFYNDHNDETAELGDHLSAAWSKLEAYAVRLALALHMSRWAGGDRKLRDPSLIDARSFESAIALVEWFKYETRRVYDAFAESEADRSRRELIELIQRRGGVVTANQLRQFTRRYRDDPEAAERVLADLVADNIGQWETCELGRNGRPTRAFRLSTVYETQATSEEFEGFVDIDTPKRPDNARGAIGDNPEIRT